MTEDCAALLHNRLYGSKNENIIKALAAGQTAEHAHGIVAGGVYIVKLYAEFLGFLGSVDGSGAGKSCVVNIGDNEKRGMNVAVNGIVAPSPMGPAPARMAILPFWTMSIL